MALFNRLTMHLKVRLLSLAFLLPLTGCITPQVSGVTGHADVGAPQLYPQTVYEVAKPISPPAE